MDDFSLSLESEAVEILLTDSCIDTENNDGRHIICRNFNITLISAQNLPDVRKFFDNRVQAKVTIGGDKSTTRETQADEENGLNPFWNCQAAYAFSETSIMHKNLSVVVKLYSKRTLGDRCIGEVNMSLKALFDDWAKGGSATLTCPIKQGNVETSAVLNVSYCFGDRFSVKKPALWKKCLKAGAIVLLKLTLLARGGRRPNWIGGHSIPKPKPWLSLRSSANSQRPTIEEKTHKDTKIWFCDVRSKTNLRFGFTEAGDDLADSQRPAAGVILPTIYLST